MFISKPKETPENSNPKTNKQNNNNNRRGRKLCDISPWKDVVGNKNSQGTSRINNVNGAQPPTSNNPTNEPPTSNNPPNENTQNEIMTTSMLDGYDHTKYFDKIGTWRDV